MSSMWSGKDFLNRCVLSRRRKVESESANVTSSGKLFQVCGPTTGKARLPTVDSLVGGTVRRLVTTERSDRRLDRSVTRVKGPIEVLFRVETFAGPRNIVLDGVLIPLQIRRGIRQITLFTCLLFFIAYDFSAMNQVVSVNSTSNDHSISAMQ